MRPEQIQKLKAEYTGRLVAVEAGRPELARFQGMTGRVKTVNFSGRALVEFDGNNDRGWYDIELDYLKVVEPSEPEPPALPHEPADQVKLSPLELARMARQSTENGPNEGRPESADAG